MVGLGNGSRSRGHGCGFGMVVFYGLRVVGLKDDVGGRWCCGVVRFWC